MTHTVAHFLYICVLIDVLIITTDTLIKRLPGWELTECAAGVPALRVAPQSCTVDADCTAMIGAVCDITSTTGTHQCKVLDAGTCITAQHCVSSPLGPKCKAGHCAL
jgi:hypothetical protein